ncbi:hypothetical protein BCON_0565g00030 [Botryotinia convoluta]|uniref:Uncharacterized protein n=1 Tax=Botryotinia convoluta TaxID=54673 RepID=A0A4Z1H6K7_9HELO|nr:hypothetical protein BCON_0565g00030 [Botryotinia convoluta]
MFQEYRITIKAPESPIDPIIDHCNKPRLKLKLTPGTAAKQALLTIRIPVAKQLVVTSGCDRDPILEMEDIDMFCLRLPLAPRSLNRPIPAAIETSTSSGDYLHHCSKADR